MKSSSQNKTPVLPNTFYRLYLSACIVVVFHAVFAAPAIAIDRQQILSAGKIHGGVMIHLGCRDANLLAEFAKDSRFAAQGLTSDVRVTNRLRAAFAGKKLPGKASVQTFSGARLSYVDHLVRFLIVEDPLGVPDSELNRVLCPGGVLAGKTSSGWSISIKPWPKAMDQWTHVRHGADGNLVSADRLVGAPTNVRWIADSPPTTSMSQDVVIVSAGGRLFTVIGERPPVLFARDAFSGIELWQRPYGRPARRFAHHAFWDRPPLIAVDGRVFIAGEAIDAATGTRPQPHFRRIAADEYPCRYPQIGDKNCENPVKTANNVANIGKVVAACGGTIAKTLGFQCVLTPGNVGNDKDEYPRMTD